MRISKLLIMGAFVATTAVVASGCAYRTDLAQGNFVEQENVDKLRKGMTPKQVQFVLGTPMLTDSFDNNRWYYVYFLRKEWNAPEIKNLVVRFENGLLAELSGDYQVTNDFYSNKESIQKIDIAAIEAQAAGNMSTTSSTDATTTEKTSGEETDNTQESSSAN